MRGNSLRNLVFLAVLGAAGVAGSAKAADLPGRSGGPVFSQLPASLNWSGVYAGAHLGYGFGKAGAADVSGFLGGGQLGVNFQTGRLVFGGEVDAGYTGIDYRGFADTFRQKWLMSARGRIGYAYERFLPYLTAGFGYTTGLYKDAAGKDDNGHLGFVIGLGGEMMLTDRVSARVEFLHYRFGSESYTTPVGVRSIGATTNVLRFGMNYRF